MERTWKVNGEGPEEVEATTQHSTGGGFEAVTEEAWDVVSLVGVVHHVHIVLEAI